MKLADVVIGETYLTKIGGNLVRVVVVRKAEKPGFNYSSRRQASFAVRRAGEVRELPKSRTAAALRPLPQKPASPEEEMARLVDYAAGGLEYAADQARKRAADSK